MDEVATVLCNQLELLNHTKIVIKDDWLEVKLPRVEVAESFHNHGFEMLLRENLRFQLDLTIADSLESRI